MAVSLTRAFHDGLHAESSAVPYTCISQKRMAVVLRKRSLRSASCPRQVEVEKSRFEVGDLALAGSETNRKGNLNYAYIILLLVVLIKEHVLPTVRPRPLPSRGSVWVLVGPG